MKITYDRRPIRDKILSHLEASPNGAEQRRYLRRYFHNKEFEQTYQNLIEEGAIRESGTGKKSDPILVVLVCPTPMPILAVSAQSMTQQRIIAYLSGVLDHTSSKRGILMRFSYREDFQTVYQGMLDRKVIEEYGLGTRTRPKLVCLTFQFRQSQQV